MPGLEKELKALKLRKDWEFDEMEPPHHLSAPAPTLPAPYGHRDPTDDDQVIGLHVAIRNAGKSVPRYLFRAWSPSSGGNARLNTTRAITPLAFLDSDAFSNDIFDIPRREYTA